MRLFMLALVAAVVLPVLLRADFPAPQQVGNVSTYGHGIQRTMSLLKSSTAEKRNTVRILFYGQSITEQGWWQAVEQDLRTRFPYANLVISNRAIGGFTADFLVRTAETDLFPFYPDLVIFHAYGSLLDYERLIAGIRSRTASEIIIQTDHITLDEELEEVTDPSRQNEMSANAFRNYVALPKIARTYGAQLADLRTYWKQYLKDYNLPASALLSDHVHLNNHGIFLMGELFKPHLRYDPSVPDWFWKEAVQTYTIGKDLHWENGVLNLEFTGTRVDLIAADQANGTASVFIDGLAPADIPGTSAFTRASPTPAIWWPALIGLRSQSALEQEEWTLTVLENFQDPWQWRFSVDGSVTGFDGEGNSTETFISNSGRVVIPADAWQICRLFYSSVTAGFKTRWSVVPMHADIFIPPIQLATGVERAVTIAQGLAGGKHQLRIVANGAPSVASVRVYNPAQMKNRNGIWIAGVAKRGAELEIQASEDGKYQLQARPNLDDSGWQNVGDPVAGSVFRVPILAGHTFIRLQAVP